MRFFIAELDDGFSVLEIPEGANPIDIAVEQGGTVYDEGPFATYEDAYDAMTAAEQDTHEPDRTL